MMTCSTCRFMASPREMYYGICDPDNPDEDGDHGTCVRIIHGNGKERPGLHNELALVVDGSGYAARLLVLPTFGCVLHEDQP